MSTDDDTADDVPLVIHEQPRTEIYWNPNGHLVLSQQDQLGNDDGLVIINGLVIPGLIRCLQEKWRDYEAAHPHVQPAAPHKSAEPIPAPQAMPAILPQRIAQQTPEKKKGAPKSI